MWESTHHSHPSDAIPASWNRPGSNHDTFRRPPSIDRTAERFEMRRFSYLSIRMFGFIAAIVV